MKALKDFIIQFVSLKQGTHYFEYDLDNKFFEEFDCDDFLSSSIKVEVEFIKQSTMMLLNFNFTGKITVPCDRCLEDVTISVDGAEKLIVKFGNEVYEGTDDIIIIPENEHEINVAQFIYEFVEINIPQKRAHKEEDCDIDTLNKLNELTIKNENSIDPRWSGLDKFNN